jgi:hypothetical protein
VNQKPISPEQQAQIELVAYCVENIMPLAACGFTPSSKFISEWQPGSNTKRAIPSVIYNSEKCRVMFQLEESGFPYSYATYIYYGRLNAQDNASFMMWENEKCYCWHEIENYGIPFLENIPPNECMEDNGRKFVSELKREIKTKDIEAEQVTSHNIEENHLKELFKRCGFRSPETKYILEPIKLHTAIWNKYENRLFDLFDLRNTEQWAKYTQHVKEFYTIRGWGLKDIPPKYKIC